MLSLVDMQLSLEAGSDPISMGNVHCLIQPLGTQAGAEGPCPVGAGESAQRMSVVCRGEGGPLLSVSPCRGQSVPVHVR